MIVILGDSMFGVFYREKLTVTPAQKKNRFRLCACAPSPLIVDRVFVLFNVLYAQGIRQEFEACVPGADHFYVAFDAASNATMGTGKVALREPHAEHPAVFSPRWVFFL